MNFKKLGSIIAGAVVIVALAGTLFCTVRVPVGKVGVVYNINGTVRDKVIGQGWRVIKPSEHVNKYSIFTQQGYLSKDAKDGSKDDESFWVTTNDGQRVNVDLEYTFHFDSDKLPKVYTKYGSTDVDDIKEGFMRGKLKTWAGEAAGSFNVMEVYSTKKAVVNQALTKHLKDNFAEFGIVIETANFSRSDLDDKTKAVINERIAIEQSIQKSTLEKQLADKEAQVKLAKAQGDAEAKKAAAQGEADANAKLIQNVTPQLVEYKRLEVEKAKADAMAKWTVTTYMDGNGQPIVNTK